MYKNVWGTLHHSEWLLAVPCMALQWTMNSDTVSESMSPVCRMLPVISSFSTSGRNTDTNSALYGGAIVSNTSVTKYLGGVKRY